MPKTIQQAKDYAIEQQQVNKDRQFMHMTCYWSGYAEALRQIKCGEIIVKSTDKEVNKNDKHDRP